MSALAVVQAGWVRAGAVVADALRGEVVRAEAMRVEATRVEAMPADVAGVATMLVDAVPAVAMPANAMPMQAAQAEAIQTLLAPTAHESVPLATAVAASAGLHSWPWWLLVVAALALAVVFAWLWYRTRRGVSCELLAQRADRNGQALLALADELECYLWEQRQCGRPTGRQQHWPRVCRRVAMDHLECINRLMLDERADAPPPYDRPLR